VRLSHLNYSHGGKGNGFYCPHGFCKFPERLVYGNAKNVQTFKNKFDAFAFFLQSPSAKTKCEMYPVELVYLKSVRCVCKIRTR